jgi:hypothetical protein
MLSLLSDYLIEMLPSFVVYLLTISKMHRHYGTADGVAHNHQSLSN